MSIYNIKFPGLNLNFVINPVAFSFFKIKIYWYGVILCLGFILALLYIFYNCRRFNLSTDSITDVIFVGFVCGVIGARLYYVIFYPGDIYINNPMKILCINQGGIAIYGGLIGGFLGGSLIAKKKNINLFATFDIASLGFLIGQSIGRWGNFVNQEAFGSETNIFCRMISENTNNISVHPCFLYESIWCFVGFVFLHFFSIKYKHYNGQIFLIYLIWYGVGRFFIEALRSDSLLVPGLNIKISQIIALITVIISIIFLYTNKLRKSNVLNN